MDSLRNASYIYSTSFFITSNPAALQEVGQFASDNNIPFGFNLSAEFLLMFELENVMKSLKHADYLFANEHEAAAYSKAHNLGTDSHADIAKAIARTEKTNTQRPRTVIITNGPGEITIVVNQPGSEECDVQTFNVEPLPKDQVVDTNGAGDSFVGGFFAQLFQGKDIATCVKAAIYLSREIVQRSGCTFPEQMTFVA